MHPAIANMNTIRRDSYQEPGNYKPKVDMRHPLASCKRNDNWMPSTSNASGASIVSIDEARLRRELNEMNCPLTKFAEQLGVTTQTLYSYFNGKKLPSLKRAVEICDLLDWTLDELIGRAERTR